jgi:hypothetical protein
MQRTPTPIAIRWAPREPPLPAAAVTVPTNQTRALVAAVIHRVAAGAEVRAVAGSGRLIVFAEPDDLPWCPQARYLGWDAGVLLPTEIVPSVPAHLLTAAARSEMAGVAPLVVLPNALIFAPLPTQPVDVEALAALFSGGES